MPNLFLSISGLFVILTFIHFFSDWLFQSQYEASNKSKNTRVRAMHCTIYVTFFAPLFVALDLPVLTIFGCIAILWVSHFIIDTYIPVILWAKYLRKIPQLQETKNREELIQAFIKLWKEPVYPILFITVDQILHLSFLWLVAILMVL